MTLSDHDFGELADGPEHVGDGGIAGHDRHLEEPDTHSWDRPSSTEEQMGRLVVENMQLRNAIKAIVDSQGDGSVPEMRAIARAAELVDRIETAMAERRRR